MIRKLLRRILGPPIGDIYIVRDGTYIVGASTRLQGAERIKAGHVASLTDDIPARLHRALEDAVKIENHELQDGDA